MGIRKKPHEESRRPSGVSDGVEHDATSSGDTQVMPTRTRVSQRSAPEPRNIRDKPPHGRVSFDSEPSKIHALPSTHRKHRFFPDGELEEIDTSDSDEENRAEPPRGINQKNSRPMFESQRSFVRTAEIFGTDAPIPLCRDPAAQASDAHRNDLNVMAESIAGAHGKEGDVAKLPTRTMDSFSTEALRGFGEYRVPFASGVDVEQLADTIRRIAVSRRRDLYRYGFRFFLTENMRNAIETPNFGSYAHSFVKEDCLFLGDFRAQSMGRLAVCHPYNVKQCGNDRLLPASSRRCQINRHCPSKRYMELETEGIGDWKPIFSPTYISIPLKHTPWSLSSQFGAECLLIIWKVLAKVLGEWGRTSKLTRPR